MTGLSDNDCYVLLDDQRVRIAHLRRSVFEYYVIMTQYTCWLRPGVSAQANTTSKVTVPGVAQSCVVMYDVLLCSQTIAHAANESDQTVSVDLLPTLTQPNMTYRCCLMLSVIVD